MNITIRLDDITPDMDWDRFLKFKALLDKYQVKPLIGIVPDNQDVMLKGNCPPKSKEAFYDYIKQLQEQGWTIAMHGYQHIYSTSKGGVFPLNHFSEFAGCSLEEQKYKISEGKCILKEYGIETCIFMAPAHSYDRNTIQALKENGFTEITDGFGARPYQWRGIKFYPISFLLSRTFRKNKGYSTMVVHTGTVSEDELGRYEQYFANPKVHWISYEEYRKIPAVSRSAGGRIREYLLATVKNFVGRIRNR